MPCIVSESGKPLPTTPKGLEPGLYLRLFHGRSRPDEDLSDWGTDGPYIGPLEYVHCTYLTELGLGFKSAVDHERYFSDGIPGDCRTAEIRFKDDLAVYAGVFYGDWSVSVVGKP